MAKAKRERVIIILACSQCKRRNYTFRRNRKKGGRSSKKLELKKYCKFCRKRTTHKETR